MPKTKSLLRSLLAIGAAGALAGFGTFSAFSSSTENPGNKIEAGTVVLADNDSGSALYDVSGAVAGTTVDRCITVTYSGDLDADVKLYLPDAVGPLAPYVDMTVTPGTDASPSFGDCTGFVADGAPLFTGTLQSFRAAHSGWANGLVDNPGSGTEWSQGSSVTYRVQLTLQDDNSAQGKVTGTHRLMWEARNQ
ncbi:MAG TPA: SipW-dependent-type signal peptide-containing protein [Solirubrobacteraceae bacterium]|nr:SipW-dependent-type signal peptide-containing protein [Solirubrobacteraceae bacterium]